MWWWWLLSEIAARRGVAWLSVVGAYCCFGSKVTGSVPNITRIALYFSTVVYINTRGFYLLVPSDPEATDEAFQCIHNLDLPLRLHPALAPQHIIHV